MNPIIQEYLGTHFSIGEQMGRDLAAQGFCFDIEREVLVSERNQQVAIHREWYPQHLEWLEGLAAGAGLPAAVVQDRFLCREIGLPGRHLRDACTIAYMREGRAAMLIRNYDMHSHMHDRMGFYRIAPDQGFAYFALSDMEVETPDYDAAACAVFSPDDIINEAGLFVGLTYAYTDEEHGYGLSPTTLQRLVAEQCVSVDEGRYLLSSAPLSYPKNFVVAGPGDAAVIERVGDRSGLVRLRTVMNSGRRILAKTNHALSPELLATDTVLSRPASTTFTRYHAALQVAAGSPGETLHDVDMAADTFRSTTGNLCETGVATATVWTLAMNCTTGQFNIRFGKDGEHSYRSDVQSLREIGTLQSSAESRRKAAHARRHGRGWRSRLLAKRITGGSWTANSNGIDDETMKPVGLVPQDDDPDESTR